MGMRKKNRNRWKKERKEQILRISRERLKRTRKAVTKPQP